MFDPSVCYYNESKRIWRFNNGSIIKFGYCENEKDVLQYKSAEYDIIRFDEVTDFSGYQYTYLLSRIRGANDFPKQIKSSGNPGGIGHAFIKERFIDRCIIGTPFVETKIDKRTGKERKRSFLFIPAKVTDNIPLMEKDPNYIGNLEELNEIEQQRLLYGNWDVFEGQYYSEWDRDIHVVKPFEISKQWKRFISLDYGLDMCAALWWAVDGQGQCYIYRELHKPNLNLKMAAEEILSANNGDKYEYIVASPDLWNRRQETGESGFELLIKYGLSGLIKANNKRIPGWRLIREYLDPYEDEQGIKRAKLSFFPNCLNILRCLPLLQFDKNNAEDCSGNDHDITHAPDALRYGAMSRPQSNFEPYGNAKKDQFGRFFGNEEEIYNAELNQFINYI
jgi:hypothetical protein